MFRQMKNIDTAFRHVRSFTLLVVVSCTLLCGFVLYRSQALVARMQDKVYVLAHDKALEAYAADRKDNIGVEARDHVRTFHQLFFTLDPDEAVIQANVSRALYLADASAKQAYDNLKESGYYTRLIAGNISQRIAVDSIRVDLRKHPYRFRCYGTQRLVRASGTLIRSLVTEGRLRNVHRSDHNPHGFLIEGWLTVENRDLKTERR